MPDFCISLDTATLFLSLPLVPSFVTSCLSPLPRTKHIILFLFHSPDQVFKSSSPSSASKNSGPSLSPHDEDMAEKAQPIIVL